MSVLSEDQSVISHSTESGRKNSVLHTAPNMFCRQSSITSKKSAEYDPLIKKKPGEDEGTKLIKNKVDLLVLISMAAIYFIGTCAFSMIAPFFAPEAAKKDADGTVTGLIFAVYPLVVFIVSPIIGKFLPLIGPKFCLVAGCFLEGGSEILFGFVVELESGVVFITFCFLIRVVTALGSSASQTAVLAIVSTRFEDNMSTMFGILEVFSGLGFMVGPALGGVLYQVGGFKLPFVAVGGCAILVLIGVAFVLPGDSAFRNVGESEEIQQTGSLTDVLRIPGILMMGTVPIVGGMVLSFLDPTFTNHLEDITNNGLSSEKVGLVFMIPSVLYTLCAPVVGMVTDKKISGRYVVILGELVCCIAYLLLGPSPLFKYFITANLWIICIASAIMGIGIGGFIVPVLADMKKSAQNAGLPDNFATTSIISGVFNSVFSIGSVIGPTLGGSLTDLLSFSWASTIFAFALLFQVFVLIIFTIWERNSKWSGKKIHHGYQPLDQC